jgi:hypothetical protein
VTAQNTSLSTWTGYLSRKTCAPNNPTFREEMKPGAA